MELKEILINLLYCAGIVAMVDIIFTLIMSPINSIRDRKEAIKKRNELIDAVLKNALNEINNEEEK